MARRGSLRLWPGDKSRMSREAPVRFCEGPGVKLPRATRLSVFVGSERAGKRVLESIRTFIEGRLRLVVDEEKSSISRPT